MQIQIKNLTYVYNQKTTFEKIALNNINLLINSGEFVAIIGQTGSGKSTLIQHLNGILKPTSGQILIDNIDIFDKNLNFKKVRQSVGLIFQYPEYQLFETTVLKDVIFGPINMGYSYKEALMHATNALELVKIPKNCFEKSPFELSGGQKRRVAIAGVLAMQPKILVLDEPTAGLDPMGRDDILNHIKFMHQNLKITIIFVSHSMEDVSKLADRVIAISDGCIVIDDLIKNAFSKPDLLENIGLTVPQVSDFMRKLNEHDFEVPTDIYTCTEAIDAIKKNILKLE